MKEFKIGQKIVGSGHRPFLIAEMSGNHNQSLERALEIVDVAAKSGADAVKIQTYTADTMTLDVDTEDFFISDDKNLWKGKSLYKLYQEAHTPWEWHKPIFERCKELGLECFSTPFDDSAVDFLEELNVSCYKIASFENTYIPLLKKIAKTKKPVIMSTGMATVGELSMAVKTLQENGCKDLVLLKCTSTYPADPKNTNIKTIPHMRDLFNVQIGLSDHTMGCGVAVASVALGATIIEKHFTLSRNDGGVDSAFSMEPAEFKILAQETENAWKGLGSIIYGSSADEEKYKKYRRSIYISENIKAGETLSHFNIKCVRPALGMDTRHYEEVLGKTVSCDLKKGMPLKFSYLKA